MCCQVASGVFPVLVWFRGSLRGCRAVCGAVPPRSVQLLLGLLETRAPADPVPVLLTLAGWDVEIHRRLQDWLAARLGEDYPALRAVGATMPRALVDQGMVVPVLDGLDELPEKYRPKVIAALNTSLGATGPVVVTSRTTDFAAAVDAGDVLTAAAAIEAEPLTATDAANYLTSCLPPPPGHSWTVVLNALRQDAARSLAAVCATPLGLWLLRTVYITGRRDPSPLVTNWKLHPDAAAIEDHLLEDLIPAVVEARPPFGDPADPLRPRHHWDPADVRHWLSYFAQHQGGAPDLLWWQLARRTLTAPIVCLLGGLVGGLIFGLGVGLLGGLAVGLVVGQGIGQEVADSFAGEPSYASLRLRGRLVALAHSITTNLVGWLVVGLMGGLLAGLRFGLETGLVFGLVSVLVGGLIGLVEWAELPSRTDRAATPTSTHRGDRTFFILRAVLGGLVFGLVSGWSSG
jgi:hypothetical protein